MTQPTPPPVFTHEFDRKLRAAFIGCGGHALRNVYPTFQYAPVDLVAVCDLDAGRAASCARQFGAAKSYTSHTDMLAAEQPEVVFIVTNYDEEGRPRYPRLAADCMHAGAHVWIEKPPASSIEEIQQMQRLSTETGKQVGVGFKKMFFPATTKAKEISEAPLFGNITSISARYPQSLPPLEQRADRWKMMGFLDHMVHPHSMLLYLAGPLEWLFVNRNALNGACVVSLGFRSGAVGSLHFSAGMGQHSFLERTEIIGEGESVVVENNLRVTYYRKSPGPGPYGRTGSYYSANPDTAPVVWEPEFSLGQLYNKGMFLLGYVPEILHFTQALILDQPPARGTLDDALELMRIYEAYCKPDGQIHRIG